MRTAKLSKTQSIQCKDDNRRTIHVVGDKAYGSKGIHAFLLSQRMRQVVDNKKNSLRLT
jgi:hypothetical protein